MYVSRIFGGFRICGGWVSRFSRWGLGGSRLSCRGMRGGVFGWSVCQRIEFHGGCILGDILKGGVRAYISEYNGIL